MCLILSSDTFEIFSLIFIEKISGINPVSTSAVRYEASLSNSNSPFSRNFAVMKCESENRAHTMMKNLTRNMYVFGLR